MQAWLAKMPQPAPQVISVDELSIKKVHTYHIVVSDLEHGRPIWVGGCHGSGRRAEDKRVAAKDRAFIKGQRYTLLSHRANLTLAGRRSLRKLLRVNKRLATAYLLKEEFGQLRAYGYRDEEYVRLKILTAFLPRK